MDLTEPHGVNVPQLTPREAADLADHYGPYRIYNRPDAFRVLVDHARSTVPVESASDDEIVPMDGTFGGALRAAATVEAKRTAQGGAA